MPAFIRRVLVAAVCGLPVSGLLFVVTGSPIFTLAGLICLVALSFSIGFIMGD